ncbi:MAG: adenosylcobinamide-phosphate synthase CbiB [Acidimicrobiales bacterium]
MSLKAKGGCRKVTRHAAQRRLLAAAAGYFLDRVFGEPPVSVHPVRAFGTLMGILESALYRDRRLHGAVYSVSGMAVAAAAGLMVPSVALAVLVTTGGRALEEAATAVAQAIASADIPLARERVRALVGRDPEHLDEPELVRAVVESVAENTNDAVIAPLSYALAGGAFGAYCYRAVNTLDSMVGYPNDRYLRFGWASARLDDVAGFLPARLTALFVIAVRPAKWRQVVRAVRQDARLHPSPNAGVAEAAFAAALGLRLGGTNSYGGQLEQRPALGEGRPPKRADIERAVRLSRHVGTAAAVSTLMATAVLWWRARWCARLP